VTAGTRDGRATFRNADQTTRQGLELSWQQTIWKELNIQSSLVISMLNLIVIQQK
jgi:iron complex outermembrane receptor protein